MVSHVLQPSLGPQRAWEPPATLRCLWEVLWFRTELPTPACGTEAKATPQTMPTMEHGNTILKGNLCKTPTFEKW